MKCLTSLVASVLVFGLFATSALSQQLDFRYLVESEKNLFLCRVHNATDEELRIAPCGDDENCLWITKGSRSWGLPYVFRRWGGHPPRSFYRYVSPGATTSLLWSGWPPRWMFHDEGRNFRATLKWRIWDRWDQKYDIESEGISIVFLSRSDTSGTLDDSLAMLSCVCFENRCRNDVFAVPKKFFTNEEENGQVGSHPCFILRSPSTNIEDNVDFQTSFLVNNSEMAQMEDLSFVSWKSIFDSLDDNMKALLSKHGDVDLSWVCNGVESECLRLWIKPDDPPPRPETAADYEYDEEELARCLDRLGITPEGKEELRNNGGLNQLTLWLIQDGTLPAKKKEAKNDGESQKVDSSSGKIGNVE